MKNTIILITSIVATAVLASVLYFTEGSWPVVGTWIAVILLVAGIIIYVASPKKQGYNEKYQQRHNNEHERV